MHIWPAGSIPRARRAAGEGVQVGDGGEARQQQRGPATVTVRRDDDGEAPVPGRARRWGMRTEDEWRRGRWGRRGRRAGVM
jgi:hypothetical protein